MSILDLSADLGLVAVALVTVNICLGLLMATRYSPVRRWPHRQFDIFRFHRYTAYTALALIMLHPSVLLLLREPHFRMLDIALPLWSPSQPVENTIGAVALYLVLLAVITSLLRVAIGRRIWKRLHYLNYVAAAALFVHSILTDSELKNRPVDWLDGEKVLVEICLLAVVVFSFLRLKFGIEKEHRERALHVGRYAPHLVRQQSPMER